MVKFFGGNEQPYISKRQKDLSEKSIPFVLEWYGKMSLLDIYNPRLYGYKVAIRRCNNETLSEQNIVL